MKYFIASDIHGSAYWCEKMLERYRAEKADKLVLLGDILYHGPRNDLPRDYAPKRVIEMLNAEKDEIICVHGNCDAEVDQMVLAFPITDEYTYLPLDGNSRALLTHGHKIDSGAIPSAQTGDAVISGHTHVPTVKNVQGVLYLNPGSVSIPKEGSRNGYLIYENGSFVRRDMDGNDEFVCELKRGL